MRECAHIQQEGEEEMTDYYIPIDVELYEKLVVIGMRKATITQLKS
jgi:hypothetical protein